MSDESSGGHLSLQRYMTIDNVLFYFVFQTFQRKKKNESRLKVS